MNQLRGSGSLITHMHRFVNKLVPISQAPQLCFLYIIRIVTMIHSFIDSYSVIKVRVKVDPEPLLGIPGARERERERNTPWMG